MSSTQHTEARVRRAKEREAESLNLPEAMEMIQAGREGVERLKLVAALL